MTFSTLGLSDELLRAVDELGYIKPTAIQEKVIPVILAGSDLLAASQTGTGKTAAFILPILQKLSGERKRRAKRIRVLILVPTRELAAQINSNINQYGKYLSLRSMEMVGGVNAEHQKQQLIEGLDIVVATPGRLLDMAHQRAVFFDELELLVLDEADRMLDMGFIADINKILNRLPEQRQNLLFSATLSDEVRKLAKTAIDDPVEVSTVRETDSSSHIKQWLITVDKDNKSALLAHLIKTQPWTQALIFIRTKHGAAKLVSQMEKRGIKAEAIHSGRSQAVRSKLLADFKSGEIGLLVATGIAARGIDIDELPRVINYDLPDDADDYIHRIGRTGRAGATGEAVSLVSRDDFKRLCAIERRLDQLIARKEIDGFAAVKEVPVSNLNHVRKSAEKAPNRAAHNAQAAKRKHQVKARVKPKDQKKPSGNSATEKADPWSQWFEKNKP